MVEKQYFIQADLYNGVYAPTEISDNLEKLTSNFEYGDVAEGNYQIWTFPKCIIYKVTPDKTVDKINYYSIAGSGWNPRIVEIGTDKAMVTDAYNRLLHKIQSH